MLRESSSVQRTRIFLSVSVLFLLIFNQFALAASVTLNPLKDVTLYEPEAEKSNGSGDYIISGNTDNKGVRRAILAFDIAGNVPGGVTIESVSLTLHVSRRAPGSYNEVHTLHEVLEDWGEGASDAGDPEKGGDPTSAEENDATWVYTFYNTNNPSSSPEWADVGGTFNPTASASQTLAGDGFYTWSSAQMVTDVQNWLDSPTTNFGWILIGNEAALKTARRLDSREHPTAANRPQLVVVYGEPATPPDVTVDAPNGGETLTANTATTIQWTADDESGISKIDLYLSDDGGSSYTPLAFGLTNSGSYTWFPANRPTTQAKVMAVATDNTLVTASDESDTVFTIVTNVPDANVPTTLRDFDMPGTQPLEGGEPLESPQHCAVCHGDYDADKEPYRNWQGSMMAHASLDPIFKANLVIANQDAPDSGDMCLRCHFSRGWLDGRSIPTTGSQMTHEDKIGVSCSLCHRMVDPIADPNNPTEDAAVLAALSNPPTDFGNGMYVVDPTITRRGPFPDADSGHPIIFSPFHKEAALCGTCHDVHNPAFSKDGSGNYPPNAFDTPATLISANASMPVERTYSEWLNSAFNSPMGVYAPEFGGNLDSVATCQDCHMRDVTGQGCDPAKYPEVPTRTDLPLHDMTGGSTWIPGLLSTLYPADVNEVAIQAGITRARYMLQNAAELKYFIRGDQLHVTVTNKTGHKLPTGYPEGRRMWLNVKFYDPNDTLLSESGAYDAGTGILTHDAEAKIYEVKPGLDADVAALVGEPVGPSFHFVLNNKVFKDNRIPPRGFTNAAYAEFGGSPVSYTYADDQYWDDTYYTIPVGSTKATVTLYYQSTSKEFIEFLRDENVTNTEGQDLYNLWNNNDKCPPETMEVALTPVTDFDTSGSVDLVDFSEFASHWGKDCAVSGSCGEANLDGIGGVDLADLLIFIESWLWGR